MPSLDWLLKEYEFRHHWSKQGDEWDGNADYSRQPYEKWKQSVFETFIFPHVSGDSSVLEYGVGQGRWTEPILVRAKEVIGVAISRKCIDFCKQRFAQYKNATFIESNGRDLSFVGNESIDFLWSFGTFTQIEADIISGLFLEFQRILKRDGVAIIHHPGRRNITLWLWPLLEPLGPVGRRIYQIVSLKKLRKDDGFRSNVSKEYVANLARRNRLTVQSQIQSWGPANEFNVKLFRDYMTTMTK
ncbi:MAG: class I SAM-dependent methyltransferase [Thermodesulfobacteriota bacterium]